MVKSKFVILAVSLVLPLTSVSPAHSATIKNGVKCSKLNLKAKVGSKNYKCAKNPYFKPDSLTWTLRECLTARSLLASSKQQYEDWKDIAASAGPEGDKVIKELLTSISELEATMKNDLCKKGA